MPIRFECEFCGKELGAKEELAGKRFKCPGCSKAITVPEPGSQQEAAKRETQGASAPEAPAGSQPGAATTEPPEAATAAPAADSGGAAAGGASRASGEQPRPRQTRPRSGLATLILGSSRRQTTIRIVAAWAVFAVVLVIILIVRGREGPAPTAEKEAPKPKPEGRASELLAASLPGTYRVRIETEWAETDGWTCAQTLETAGTALDVSLDGTTWKLDFFGRPWEGSTEKLRSLNLSVPWGETEDTLSLINQPTGVEKAELALRFDGEKLTVDVNELQHDMRRHAQAEPDSGGQPAAPGAFPGAGYPPGDSMSGEGSMMGGPGMSAAGMGASGMGGPGVMPGRPNVPKPGFVRFDVSLIDKSQEPPPGEVLTSGDLLAGEIKRLAGHQSRLLSLQAAAQGGHVVTSDAEGIVRRWSLETADGPVIVPVAETRCFPGFVHLLPDAQRMLSAAGRGQSARLRLWPLEGQDGGKRFELKLSPPRDPTQKRHASWTMHFADLAVSADGKRAMTVTLFGQPFATVWDIESAKPLSTMRLAVAGRRGDQRVPPRLQGGGIVALSADGRRAMVNGSVWDVDNQKVIATAGPKGLADSMAGFAFSPDASLAAIGYESQAIVLWQIASGEHRGTCLGSESAPRALAFSPDAKRLLSCGLDGVTRLWDVDSAREVRRFRWATSPGDAAAGESSRGKVEPSAWESLHAVDRSPVRVAFTADGKSAISSDPAGTIHVWDLEASDDKTEPVPSVEALAATWLSLPGDQRVLAESADGKLRLLEVGRRGQGVLRIWDTQANQAVRDLSDPESPGTALLSGRLMGAAFSPQGDLLATRVSHERLSRVWLWSPAQEKPLRATQEGPLFPGALAFAADGRYVVVNAAGSVQLLDVGNFQAAHTLEGIWRVLALSRDGNLVAAEADATAKFGSPTTGGPGMGPGPPRSSRYGPMMYDSEDEYEGESPYGMTAGRGPSNPVIVVRNVDSGEEVCRVNPADLGGSSEETRRSQYESRSGGMGGGRSGFGAGSGFGSMMGSAPSRDAGRWAARFTPNGKYLVCTATGRPASAIVMVDLKTGQQVRRFEAEAAEVGDATTNTSGSVPPATSPRSPSGMGGGDAAEYEGYGYHEESYAAARPGRHEASAVAAAFTCLDVSPSGRRLAAGADQGTVYVFDVEAQRRLAKIGPTGGIVEKVSFRGDALIVVSAAMPDPAGQVAARGTAYMGSAPVEPTKTLTYRIAWPDPESVARDAEPAPDVQRTAIDFTLPAAKVATAETPPRRELLTQARSVALQDWQGLPMPAGQAQGPTVPGAAGPPSAFVLLPDGRQAISRGKDSQLHVVDLATGESVRTLESSSSTLEIWADAEFVIGVTGLSAFEKWEVATGRYLGRAEFFDFSTSGAMEEDFYPDEMMGAGMGGYGPSTGVSSWAIAPSRQWAVLGCGVEARVVELRRFARPAPGAAKSRSGRRRTSPAAVCALRHTIKMPAQMPGGAGICSVAVSADSGTIFVGLSNGWISAYEASTARPLRRWRAQSPAVSLVASPNGSQLMSFADPQSMMLMPQYMDKPHGQQEKARLWEVAQGKQLLELGRPATLAAFSADATLAASTLGDHLSLWDLKTGSEIAHVFLGGNARTVAFLPDASQVVTLSDRSLTFWQLDPAIRKEAALPKTDKPDESDPPAQSAAPDGSTPAKP